MNNNNNSDSNTSSDFWIFLMGAVSMAFVILIISEDTVRSEIVESTPIMECVDTIEPQLEPHVWVSQASPHEGNRYRAYHAVRTLTDNLSRDFSTLEVEERADIIAAASRYTYEETGYEIDPFDLAIIWRYETGFSLFREGDYENGRARSCGATQIRTDFVGRPTCDELRNPYVALRWTAMELAGNIEDEGHVDIRSYNGGGNKATLYEVRHYVTYTLLERVLDGMDYDRGLERYVHQLIRNSD